MSPMLLGKKIDLIPHTGIVVFGKEYFFGSGPCVGEPGKTVPVSVSQVLDLGETGKVSEELEASLIVPWLANTRPKTTTYYHIIAIIMLMQFQNFCWMVWDFLQAL